MVLWIWLRKFGCVIDDNTPLEHWQAKIHILRQFFRGLAKQTGLL